MIIRLLAFAISLDVELLMPLRAIGLLHHQ